MSEILPLDASRRAPPAEHSQPTGAARGRQRRAVFIKWLRRVHGWVGLWGAVLGLLFGVTGVVLNHRAAPGGLRIGTGEPITNTVQIPAPEPLPDSPRELARALQTQLGIAGTLGRVMQEPAHRVAWGDRSVQQPAHWQMSFAGPHESTQIEYWVGNKLINVKHSEVGTLAFLTNLHKGVGLSLGWILLVDTLAGSIILLSLTGVLLWTAMHKRRLVGLVLVGGSIAASFFAAGYL